MVVFRFILLFHFGEIYPNQNIFWTPSFIAFNVTINHSSIDTEENNQSVNKHLESLQLHKQPTYLNSFVSTRDRQFKNDASSCMQISMQNELFCVVVGHECPQPAAVPYPRRAQWQQAEAKTDYDNNN